MLGPLSNKAEKDLGAFDAAVGKHIEKRSRTTQDRVTTTRAAFKKTHEAVKKKGVEILEVLHASEEHEEDLLAHFCDEIAKVSDKDAALMGELTAIEAKLPAAGEGCHMGEIKIQMGKELYTYKKAEGEEHRPVQAQVVFEWLALEVGCLVEDLTLRLGRRKVPGDAMLDDSALTATRRYG